MEEPGVLNVIEVLADSFGWHGMRGRLQVAKLFMVCDFRLTGTLRRGKLCWHYRTPQEMEDMNG